jgi:hypothetical protein
MTTRPATYSHNRKVATPVPADGGDTSRGTSEFSTVRTSMDVADASTSRLARRYIWTSDRTYESGGVRSKEAFVHKLFEHCHRSYLHAPGHHAPGPSKLLRTRIRQHGVQMAVLQTRARCGVQWGIAATTLHGQGVMFRRFDRRRLIWTCRHEFLRDCGRHTSMHQTGTPGVAADVRPQVDSDDSLLLSARHAILVRFPSTWSVACNVVRHPSGGARTSSLCNGNMGTE